MENKEWVSWRITEDVKCESKHKLILLLIDGFWRLSES